MLPSLNLTVCTNDDGPTNRGYCKWFLCPPDHYQPLGSIRFIPRQALPGGLLVPSAFIEVSWRNGWTEMAEGARWVQEISCKLGYNNSTHRGFPKNQLPICKAIYRDDFTPFETIVETNIVTSLLTIVTRFHGHPSELQRPQPTYIWRKWIRLNGDTSWIMMIPLKIIIFLGQSDKKPPQNMSERTHDLSF